VLGEPGAVHSGRVGTASPVRNPKALFYFFLKEEFIEAVGALSRRRKGKAFLFGCRIRRSQCGKEETTDNEHKRRNRPVPAAMVLQPRTLVRSLFGTPKRWETLRRKIEGGLKWIKDTMLNRKMQSKGPPAPRSRRKEGQDAWAKREVGEGA
jgi:hypothetical protein